MEAVWLKVKFDVPIFYHDYLFGTVPFALGVSMLALRSSPRPNAFVLWAARIGRYGLGIYAVHYIFIDLLLSSPPNIPFPYWDVALPFVVVALSSLTAVALARLPGLRQFVI